MHTMAKMNISSFKIEGVGVVIQISLQFCLWNACNQFLFARGVLGGVFGGSGGMRVLQFKYCLKIFKIKIQEWPFL